jgi:hypothetical protein
MSHVLTPDYATLPAAILPLAKEQLRIDFTDDDATITRQIGAAISYFEKFTGQQIFGAEVAWTPLLELGWSAYPTPVQPVRSFTVLVESVDVSAEYELRARSAVEPVYLAKIDGTAFPAAAAITLQAGYDDAATIDPSILDVILRVTAALFEHRESISAISIEQVPFWLNDLMGGHWIPRA